tara:strand:+ start:224 stop:742 length:519 start_codon:yes stop_codon:yes gene_type:complete
MESLPEEIYFYNMSKYLTFRDLGNLIKTSKFFRHIYNNTDLWKKIYLMTCPNKWEFTDDSIHLNYSEKFRYMLIKLCNSWKNDLSIDIHECNEVFKIWNCQTCVSTCNDITHYDISTLKSTKVRNYNYKKMVIDKSRSRLVDKEKNIIFLKQLIFPKRLEWYDVINSPTFNY